MLIPIFLKTKDHKKGTLVVGEKREPHFRVMVIGVYPRFILIDQPQMHANVGEFLQVVPIRAVL